MVWNSSKSMNGNIDLGVLNNLKNRSCLEKWNNKDGWANDCGHRLLCYSLGF